FLSHAHPPSPATSPLSLHDALPILRTPYGSRVRALGVRRKVKHVAVASRAEYDGVPAVCFDLPRDKIAGDNTSRHAIDHNQVEHFGSRVHLHFSRSNLPV